MMHERYAACRRCAAEHPGEAPAPLAVLSDDTPPYEGTPLLYRAVRVWGRRRRAPGTLWHRAGYDAEPLSPDAAVPVLLRCRRCGLRIGPISAGRVAELFDRGRAEGRVLLLPVPPGRRA